jgi:hypothetical protein
LSTKNWAYLVNELALFSQRKPRTVDEIQLDGSLNSEGPPKQTYPPQDARFEPLPVGMTKDEKERKTEFRSLPDFDLKTLFLTLWRRPGLTEGTDELYFEMDQRHRSFICSTYFPAPTDDFLLYLCLAGSVEYPGLRVFKAAGEGKVETRISASNLLKRVLKSSIIKSASAISPNWEQDEMLVSASFMTACNAGLGGCSLEAFLSRFVSELLALDKHEYVELGIVVKIKWSGEFNAQFMWPFNTRLPGAVNKILNTVESTRPPNSQMFDAGTFVQADSSDKVSLKCLIEVKSSIDSSNLRTKIKDALARQDSYAKVSFIVVDASIERLRNFDLSQYKVLDRSQRDKQTRAFVKGEPITNARLFKVGIDESTSVQLTPMDGETSDTANRLIFLISRDDIAQQCEQSLALVGNN